MPVRGPAPTPVDGTSPAVDVLVRTFNSARDLAVCLESARRHLPVHCLIVVDRHSTDGTDEIARRYGARLETEEVGLGYATTRALQLADTPMVVFLDSDVEVVDPAYYRAATGLLQDPRSGAVVGSSVGHPFHFGLPLSLAMLRRDWALRVQIPPALEGRETFFFQRALRADGLRVRYVPEAIVHRSRYRGRDWPEWQGAQTRRAAGISGAILAYSVMTILLVALNSRSARNLAYTPIFAAKFLHGYARPGRFADRDRRQLDPV